MQVYKTIEQYENLIYERKQLIKFYKKSYDKKDNSYLHYNKQLNRGLFDIKKEYNQAIKFYKANPEEFYISECKDAFLNTLQYILNEYCSDIYDLFNIELEVEYVEDNTCYILCTLIVKNNKKVISFHCEIYTDDIDKYFYGYNKKDEDLKEMEIIFRKDGDLPPEDFDRENFFSYLAVKYLTEDK